MVADDAEAWIEKGDRLKVEGLIVEALDCYVRAREIAPDDVEAWTSEGFCLQELGQSASAVACLTARWLLTPAMWTSVCALLTSAPLPDAAVDPHLYSPQLRYRRKALSQCGFRCGAEGCIQTALRMLVVRTACCLLRTTLVGQPEYCGAEGCIQTACWYVLLAACY